MSYMSAGSVMGQGSRSAVVFPGTTPATEGAFEPQVLALSPAVYLKMADTADSSGNGRNATLGGTGGAFVSAISPNVGTGNGAFDTQGTAFLSVAHNAADVALTFPAQGQWEALVQANPGVSPLTLLAAFRFIAEVTIGCDFSPQTMPAGSNLAVIFAKSHSDALGTANSYAESTPILASRGNTVNGGSFAAYFDANGAVHVDMRSFRGRPCRIRTPDGAVTTGQRYRLEVTLGYDGVAAWLNGAKFEDGYGNLMHVYGLAADIRGASFRNNYTWTIGKAPWGGQADVIVDEFTIFNRRPSTTLSQSNINTLAQVGSTPAALAHYIWGAQTVNRSSFASINAAIDNVSASGGGTVLLNAGTYNENVTFKNSVRLKANGGAVTITGRVLSPTPSIATIGPGSGDWSTGDRTITINNSRAVGDLIRVQCNIMSTGTDISPRRHDRRWNTAGPGGESNDPAVNDAQSFEIESRNSTSITMVGAGLMYDFPSANRSTSTTVLAVTPLRDIALEGNITIRAATTPLAPLHVKNFRMVGTKVRNSGSGTGNRVVEIDFYSMYVQGRDCDFRHESGVAENVGVLTPQQATIDFVFKNLTCSGPSHLVDSGHSTSSGCTNRHEYHGLTGLMYSAEHNRAKFGTHGPISDSIYWNITVARGGCGVGGWKHDVRFCVLGTDASNAAGTINPNDGMGDCVLRDIHMPSQTHAWFSTEEGICGCDRCHFENITRTNTPTGGVHQLNYGTGADVNTYRNVDGLPSPNPWQLV